MTIPPIGILTSEPRPIADASSAQRPEDVKKVSQQFESILLRQFLSESMKSLLEGGPSGQVYGYLLTDSLAGSISQAGGLGLCSVLQAQLGNEAHHHAKP